MLRGHVLTVALFLAAALQLVFVPTASADGGLLDGLTSILSSNPQRESGTQVQEDDGLLGVLLGPVTRVSQPLTGDLIDSTVEGLDSTLEIALGESLSDTAAEIASPLEDALIPALALTTGLAPPETPADVPSDSASAAAPPAASPTPGGTASLLPAVGDVLESVTLPLEPVAADVAVPLVGLAEESGLLPILPAANGLTPVAQGLSPALQPLLEILAPVAIPMLKMVEPVVAPILRTIDPLLHPFTELLRTAGGPVVDAILPQASQAESPWEPGVGAPPQPGQASTAGPSLDQTFILSDVPVIGTSSLKRVLSEIIASTADGEAPSLRESGTNWSPRPALTPIEIPAAGISAGASTPVEVPQRPPSSATAGSEDREGSSLTTKAPVADLVRFHSLLAASFAVFLLILRSRSQSWLSCPVRPPI